MKPASRVLTLGPWLVVAARHFWDHSLVSRILVVQVVAYTTFTALVMVAQLAPSRMRRRWSSGFVIQCCAGWVFSAVIIAGLMALQAMVYTIPH